MPRTIVPPRLVTAQPVLRDPREQEVLRETVTPAPEPPAALMASSEALSVGRLHLAEEEEESRVDRSDAVGRQDLPQRATGDSSAPVTEEGMAHDYLSRLFVYYAPQCEPLSTLLGVCTQIDNLLVDLRARHDELLNSLREFVAPYTPSTLDICCPATRARVARAQAVIKSAEGR